MRGGGGVLLIEIPMCVLYQVSTPQKVGSVFRGFSNVWLDSEDLKNLIDLRILRAIFGWGVARRYPNIWLAQGFYGEDYLHELP